VAVALPRGLPQRFAEGGAGRRGAGDHLAFEHEELAIGQGPDVDGEGIVGEERVDADEIAWAEGEQLQRLARVLGENLAGALVDDPQRGRRVWPGQLLAGAGGLLAHVAGDPPQDAVGQGKEERYRLQ